jgi:hypothetical protein
MKALVSSAQSLRGARSAPPSKSNFRREFRKSIIWACWKSFRALNEGDGSAGAGRFGWKSQHRSLLSFATENLLHTRGRDSHRRPPYLSIYEIRIGLPIKWPKSSTPLVIAVIFFGNFLARGETATWCT